MNFFYTLLFVLIPSIAISATPRLYFSDLTNGPSTGNTDGHGGGAIVTIWGSNLGSSQGTSTLTIGGQPPAHIYYWKNADGALPGGPADLYTHHKMQEIAFSIPSSLPNGDYEIQVIVNGASSNTLPFTVASGKVYFLSPSGDDTTGDGSWSKPWRTFNNVLSGGTSSKLSAGDVVYSVGVGSTSGIRVGGKGTLSGAEGASISVSAYPGTSVSITGEGGDGAVVDNWWPSNNHNAYVNFSKISVTAYGNDPDYPNGFRVIPYGRIVGVEITGPHVYGGYGGAIVGGNGVPQGGKYLGLYIHDYGYDNGWKYNPNPNSWTSPPYDGIAGIDCTNCTSADRFQHLFYVSCRGDAGVHCEGYEIGWCNLVNNHILHGLHIYDMSPSSGWKGTISIHDNYTENLLGGAVDIATTSDSIAAVELYNNVIVNTNGPAYRIFEAGTQGIKMYNNSVYNQTTSGTIPSDAVYFNNIMFDTQGVTYFSGTPISHSNNLFYSSKGVSAPAWFANEAGGVSLNPLFVDPTKGDLSLSSNSPAVDNGASVPLVNHGFEGNARPQGLAYDIGAYELVKDDSIAPPTISNFIIQ